LSSSAMRQTLLLSLPNPDVDHDYAENCSVGSMPRVR
jgi:hypothetical protein